MNPFERLAPYIQEFVWSKGWGELRPMQGEAIETILDHEEHVLLAGGTASGKTEAAFLPILTRLDEQPSGSVGVLYIGPLKALINDQFERLDVLLHDGAMPVWPWHGDVGASVKRRALKECRGVLQTTPESLEGFLLYRKQALHHLFRDLRFVVIDEVHAFMSSDRGRQILCQLTRLERATGSTPRRIGLSATLGDYSLAESWLRGADERSVITIDDATEERKLRLGVAHYCVVDDDQEVAANERATYFDHLHQLTSTTKCLVFVNRRADAEEVGAELQTRTDQRGGTGRYFVHHGSVSKEYRLDAEEAMREEGPPACTIATVTLELGIDLGYLERVVQVGPCPSVSSLVQRLGRSGRRGSASEMYFFAVDEGEDEAGHPLQRMPWPLLLTIAQIQLYIEERFIEPVPIPERPYSLLYHQTMSILYQHGDLAPAVLAQRVLTLPPFRHVGQEDFKTLLNHLFASDHLQWTENGTILIGLTGERVVNDWRFLATFEDASEFQVVYGTQRIGTLSGAPPIDTTFRLAGRAWRVDDIEDRTRTVLVSKAQGKAESHWFGSDGPGVHERVVQRVLRVLQEDAEYRYLMPKAMERLREARELALSTGITERTIHPLSRKRVALTPWMGSRAYAALAACLANRAAKVTKPSAAPFYLIADADAASVRSALQRPITQDELGDVARMEGKYADYVPESLRRAAYVEDGLDVEGANAVLRERFPLSGGKPAWSAPEA